MTVIRPNFRNGFYAGLLVAIMAGVYVLHLWKPEQQVELHSVHLLHAIERRDADAIGEFIDVNYQDQWQHDRTLLLERLRAALRYTRNLHLEPHEPIVVPVSGDCEWQARITVAGEQNEVVTLIANRINPLKEPFLLQWRKQSWKPWDWKLIHASNEALELPAEGWLE
ncbi:MAG: hypothetical protein H0X73_01610 [Chthoniobacterales bacterium]|nr:hypothetical protein [Chthoniobacterales bacterium]